jgi:hypothetical protein
MMKLFQGGFDSSAAIMSADYNMFNLKDFHGILDDR